MPSVTASASQRASHDAARQCCMQCEQAAAAWLQLEVLLPVEETSTLNLNDYGFGLCAASCSSSGFRLPWHNAVVFAQLLSRCTTSARLAVPQCSLTRSAACHRHTQSQTPRPSLSLLSHWLTQAATASAPVAVWTCHQWSTLCHMAPLSWLPNLKFSARLSRSTGSGSTQATTRGTAWRPLRTTGSGTASGCHWQ